jgi:16S rRNA G966 N2-methylase RsmD
VSAVRARREPFDLIYADPPYDFTGYDTLLGAVDEMSLAPDALVAIEHRRRSAPWEYQPRNLAWLRRAEYGEVWITFYGASAEPDEAAATPFAVASEDPVGDTGKDVEETEW